MSHRAYKLQCDDCNVMKYKINIHFICKYICMYIHIQTVVMYIRMKNWISLP